MAVCDMYLHFSKNLEKIVSHRKESFSENLAEEFAKMTYDEYRRMVEGGVDVSVAIDAMLPVPVGGGGSYSEEQFKKAQEMIKHNQYKKMDKAVEESFIRENIGSIELAQKYNECVKANIDSNNRAGLHIAADSNDHDVVVQVWWIPDSPLEIAPKVNSFTVSGATFDDAIPHGLRLKPTGYSILLKRIEGSAVSIVVNTTKGTISETVPAIGGELGERWLDSIDDGGWTGIWDRREDTNVFDAEWRKINEHNVTAVLTLHQAGKDLFIERRQSSDGNDCDLRGTISDDGKIMSGTYKCENGGEGNWQAKLMN